jgi:SAM-dependent methyltransferase
VLDIGAGAGAPREYRLRGHGVDADPDKWIPKEIPFFEVDVNSGIAGSVRDKFDAACCLEVIEHVENPWKLFRDISETLRPGGRLLLSTPNVASFLSRLIFLRSGKFHQFGDEDIAYGHINPVTPFEMETIADRAGWRVLEVQPGGYLPIFDLSSLRPRSIAFNFLRGLAYLVSAGNKHGWCTFFVMEKR